MLLRGHRDLIFNRNWAAQFDVSVQMMTDDLIPSNRTEVENVKKHATSLIYEIKQSPISLSRGMIAFSVQFLASFTIYSSVTRALLIDFLFAIVQKMVVNAEPSTYLVLVFSSRRERQNTNLRL